MKWQILGILIAFYQIAKFHTERANVISIYLNWGSRSKEKINSLIHFYDDYPENSDLGQNGRLAEQTSQVRFSWRGAVSALVNRFWIPMSHSFPRGTPSSSQCRRLCWRELGGELRMIEYIHFWSNCKSGGQTKSKRFELFDLSKFERCLPSLYSSTIQNILPSGIYILPNPSNMRGMSTLTSFFRNFYSLPFKQIRLGRHSLPPTRMVQGWRLQVHSLISWCISQRMSHRQIYTSNTSTPIDSSGDGGFGHPGNILIWIQFSDLIYKSSWGGSCWFI